MKTPIANMIAEMHGKGIPVELIVSAVAKVEEAMAARAVSTGFPVDTSTIDKRRAWDRERKRRQRASTGQGACPPDSTGHSTGQASCPPDIPPDNASILTKEVRGFQDVVKEKKERKSARGSRIPPDFSLEERDYEFTAKLGFSRAETDAETPHFIDYWSGIPGAKGVKLTWKGTWRNRMRDLEKYRSRRGNAVGSIRTDSAAGRATARETQHVAAMGSAALRYLQEGKSAGTGRETPDGAGSAEVFDFGKRAESAR